MLVCGRCALYVCVYNVRVLGVVYVCSGGVVCCVFKCVNFVRENVGFALSVVLEGMELVLFLGDMFSLM